VADSIDDLAEYRRKRKTQQPPPPDWLVKAIVDERGHIVPNLANTLLALRAAPELRDIFAFDGMAMLAMILSAVPSVEGAEPPGVDKFPRPARDTDLTSVQEFLQWQGLPRIGKDVTHQAIDQRARERGFHPVRDYLEALMWDSKARLEEWLSRYLGVESSRYAAAIGRMFLIAMVARIFEPGGKIDYMLVLEGAQGNEKSKACRILAGDDYFSDHLPPIGSKDASQHLRGKWLVEVAELSAIGRANTELLKAFVSRQAERYRPPYGRNEVIEGRQCLFVGTTNKEAYLKDETGGRRFWPIKVGEIDIKALVADRDQLFAEAVQCYRAGERWWPDKDFEQAYIKPEQDARYESDPWQEKIADYVETRRTVRIGEIAHEALSIETSRIHTSDQRRIVGVLTTLGFVRGKRDVRGVPYEKK
jgi:predicted P-loop ATPase